MFEFRQSRKQQGPEWEMNTFCKEKGKERNEKMRFEFDTIECKGLGAIISMAEDKGFRLLCSLISLQNII